MIKAFLLAAGEVFEPAFRRVILLGIGITFAAFLVLWGVVGWLLANTSFFEWAWLDWAVDILGGIAGLVISWFLFPPVMMLVVAFFLDDVVEAVERRHYPTLPPAPGAPLWVELGSAVKLALLALALNLFLLPLYLIPGVNAAAVLASWVLNGYLVGREFFELVALRRHSPAAARALRRHHSVPVLVAGVIIAAMLWVPVLNLAAPVIGAAFMAHLYESWRRVEAS